MTNKILFTILMVMSIPVIAGSAQEAYAASLLIDDTVEDEITIAHGRSFEFGVTNNGVAYPPRVAGSETVPGETGDFTGTWYVNQGGIPDPGEGVVYFVNSDGMVTDIITANWSTIVRPGFDKATMSVTVESSPRCTDLGPLPDGFTGIPEPNGTVGLGLLFQDPVTGDSVRFPSNLGFRFVDTPAEDCTISVDVDIKPGSDVNPVNTKSKGVIPVAVYSTADFDATTIDPSTVAFGPNGAAESHGTAHIEDVNGDGLDDVVLHFKTQDSGILKGNTEASLTGATFDGTAIEGSDNIKTK